ncbi:hypothetical protein ACWEQL_33175 [Kitasatospora sp. NPDC004240]
MAFAASQPRTGPPGPPGPAPRPTGPGAPLWLVTMPTRSAGGVTGTQSFAVHAPGRPQAITAAAVRAGSDRALLRRRGARIDVRAAQATRWDPLPDRP